MAKKKKKKKGGAGWLVVLALAAIVMSKKKAAAAPAPPASGSPGFPGGTPPWVPPYEDPIPGGGISGVPIPPTPPAPEPGSAETELGDRAFEAILAFENALFGFEERHGGALVYNGVPLRQVLLGVHDALDTIEVGASGVDIPLEEAKETIRRFTSVIRSSMSPFMDTYRSESQELLDLWDAAVMACELLLAEALIWQ